MNKKEKPVPKSLNKTGTKVKKDHKLIADAAKQTEGLGKKPKMEPLKKTGCAKVKIDGKVKTKSKQRNGGEAQQKQAPKVKKPLVLAPTPTPPTTPTPTSTVKPGAKKSKKSRPALATATAVSAAKTKKVKSKPLKAKQADIQKPATNMQQKKANKRAFKKQQLKAKRTGKVKKSAPSVKLFEPPVTFDEDKFSAIVNEANVEKVADALKKLVGKEVADRKSTAIFDDFRYMLNVSSFKIPSCPKRMVKLNLKHSLVKSDDDVAIVVPDLQRGAKIDYEPTIQHYEDLFREAGITGLKVVPFNQLRNECNTFESVRKFGNTYDFFLCDGRLVGQVAGFCGKIFQKPRTTFHAVRMDNLKNLKNEIEKSLRRTAYKQLQKGDLISIPVGNNEHSAHQLAENVGHVVSQLKTHYPGGWANIRGMYLKIDITGTSSLPIYVSAGTQAPAVTPYVVGPREERLLKLKKEANEVLSKFVLTKEAQILKLTKGQVERKRKFREVREKLLADDSTALKVDKEETPPVKRTKPTKKAKAENNLTKKKVFGHSAAEDEQVAVEDDADDDTEEEGTAGEGSDSDEDEDSSDDDA